MHPRFDVPNDETGTACMYLRIANHGRRPAVLLDLVMVEGRTRWSRRRWSTKLTEPKMPGKRVRSIDEAVRAHESHYLAQNSAVRLAEGEVLDLRFWPNDFTRFIQTNFEPIATANRLYVTDFSGRKIRVTGDQSCLEKLYEAWRQEDDSQASERRPISA